MNYLWERRVAMGIELLLQTGLGWERLPIAAGFRRVSIFHDESARSQVLLLLRCESSLSKAAELEPCILFTPTLSFFFCESAMSNATVAHRLPPIASVRRAPKD